MDITKLIQQIHIEEEMKKLHAEVKQELKDPKLRAELELELQAILKKVTK